MKLDKTLIVGLIIGLIIGAAISYALSYSQISALQKQLSSLEKEAQKITSMQEKIAQLEQELSKYNKLYVEEIKKRGKLILGTSADWPPFEYVDKDGNIVGIDIEIAKKIAEKLGVKLEIKDMKFAALIEALRNGLVDIVIADMTPKAKRELLVDFSIPYYFSKGYAVVTLKGKEISKVEDLYGKKIGVQLGTIQEEWANDNLKGKAEIYSYDKVYPDMVMILKRGDIDAIIVGDIIASVITKKDPDLTVTMYVGGTSIGAAVAVPEGAEDLKYVVNQVIEELLESGEMQAIFEKEFAKYLGAD